MADTYEKDLGQKSDLTASDFIRVVGSDNVSYKQGVANLFDKILKTFTSGSIAGKTQTIKSALDESINVPFVENGRLKYLSPNTNPDFDTFTYEWVLTRSTINAPVANEFFYVHTIAYTKDSNGYVTTGKQIAFSYNATDEAVYIRRCYNGTWYAWQKMPTRAEIDALASASTNITMTIGSVSAVNSAQKSGRVCTLSIDIGNGTTFSDFTSGMTIGTLPTGFRPTGPRYNVISAMTVGTWASAGYTMVLVSVGSDGTIKLYGNESEIQACKYMTGQIVFAVG